RSSPDDLLAFLHEQLEIEHEAVRVASLDFLRAIVGADCGLIPMWKVSGTKNESTIQTLCFDILQCLDTSVNGMTQVLWPRLLEYVVPTQYTGTLKPLCRCLRELAEKKQREGEAAACLDYSGR
ncbi:unnamed protein product, partial [Caretta caretta]